MKKSKKLLIALLSATCLTAGAFGFAACGETNDSAMYKIYDEYVAALPSGQTAKTYDEWLKDALTSAAEKGDKGDQGTPGTPGEDGKDAYEVYRGSLSNDETPLSKEQWLASLVGESGVTPHIGTNGNWFLGSTDTGVKAAGTDGVSITNVEMSADGKKLLITLSGVEEPVAVTLPETMTHVHTQSNEYKMLIAPTPDIEGLGYNECTAGDGHIELVVIPTYSYKISVVLPAKNEETSEGFIPFEGATVTLKDGDDTVAEAVTDENGDAYFNKIEKKAYTYVVTADGYEVVYGGEGIYAENKTDTYNTDYTVMLVKETVSGTGSANDPYVLDAQFDKEGDMVYAYFTPEKTELHGYNLNSDVTFTFTATKSGAYYLKEMNGLEFDAVKGTYNEGMLLLNAGEQAVLTLNSDDTIYDFSLVMIGFAKEMKAGTLELPKVFEAGKEFTITSDDVDKDGYIHLYFTSAKNTYKITTSVADLELNYKGYNSDEWQYEDRVVDFSKVVADIGTGEYSFNAVTEFWAKLPAGTNSATLKVDLLPGADVAHAVDLQYNTVTTPDAGLYDSMEMTYTAWYKYVITAENAGLVTLEFADDDNFALYSEEAYGEDDAALVYANGSYPYNFAAGTYYLRVTINAIDDDGEPAPGSFKIRAYNEETDKGLSKYAPLTVVAGTATDTKYNYFKFTSAEAAEYIIDENCTVYFDANFKDEIEVSDNLLELAAGETVYFEMNIDYANYPDYYALTLTKVTDEMANTEVKYTFIVHDNNNDGQEGITVTAGGKSGTTDADGKVELMLKPGAYEVELDFGDKADEYSYKTKVTTAKSFVESETKVFVNTVRQTSIMISDYDTFESLTGIKVTLWTLNRGDKGTEGEDEWVQVGEPLVTSGSFGSVTVSYLSGETYRYTLSNVPEKYEYDKYYNLGTNNQLELKVKKETPDNPTPDDPDLPEQKYTYLYTGWQATVDGTETFKLFTTDNDYKYWNYTIKVENGIIKSLKIDSESVAVSDNTEFSFGGYDDWTYGVLALEIDLEIEAEDGRVATVIIEKVLEADYSDYE